MALRAHHRKYPALGVVGELETLPAVPLSPPDLPVQQVIGNTGLAPLVVRDFGQIACCIVTELRPVMDAAGRFPVNLRHQAADCI